MEWFDGSDWAMHDTPLFSVIKADADFPPFIQDPELYLWWGEWGFAPGCQNVQGT